MARRAKFGKGQRVVPSLTSTIVSIARQMQETVDRNITDAWQNGGMVDGKKVTDAMLLAHWRERLSKVSRDDPLYDSYKNEIEQLDYQIHESKQSTLYAQGKISNTQMASFYLGWAKKVPKDSEFYRVLQRDGAQFMQADKAKNAAAAKAAAEKAYAGNRDGILKGTGSADYITDVLMKMAQEQRPGLSSYNPDDLGPAFVQSLMDQINSDPSRVLYMDNKTGKPVTAGDAQKKLKGFDPHFDRGEMNSGYYAGRIKTAVSAITRASALATKTGHSADKKSLDNSASSYGDYGVRIGAIDVTAKYDVDRAQRDAVLNDPKSTPAQRAEAVETYMGKIQVLADTKGIDLSIRNQILTEIAGVAGAPNLSERGMSPGANDTATGGIDPATGRAKVGAVGSDSAETVATYEADMKDIADVASGAKVWMYGAPDASHPGAGQTLTAQPPPAADQGYTTTTVVQGPGLPPLTILVRPTSITVNVVGPDGSTLGGSTDSKMKFVDEVQDGQVVRMYSFIDGSGVEQWDSKPHFDTTKMSLGPDGKIYVQGDFTLGADGKIDATKLPAGYTVEGTGASAKVVVSDPGAVLVHSDKSGFYAGLDVSSSSPSLMVASLAATPGGQDELKVKLQDPAFLAAIENETRLKNGFVPDGKGGYVPGTGNQAAYDATARSIGDMRVNTAFDRPAFYRDTTTPTVKTTDTPPAVPPANPTTDGGHPGQLGGSASFADHYPGMPPVSVAPPQGTMVTPPPAAAGAGPTINWGNQTITIPGVAHPIGGKGWGGSVMGPPTTAPFYGPPPPVVKPPAAPNLITGPVPFGSSSGPTSSAPTPYQPYKPGGKQVL